MASLAVALVGLPVARTVGAAQALPPIASLEGEEPAPDGGLVLTQRCGVFGALPAEEADAGFPALDALAASEDPTTPAGGEACAIDVGEAELITSGPLAGQYFAAVGRMSQVTVVDTRAIDEGFTISGEVSDFVSASDHFDARNLGWTPVVAADAGPTVDGYDQLVLAGISVVPGEAEGLASARTLAQAPAGRGLGVASIDARLKLLVPVAADSGSYVATLTITAI